MQTTHIHKRFVTRAVGAAIAGAAVPALLFLGAGTAQAALAADEYGVIAIIDDAVPGPARTNVIERPGHVSIQTEPSLVTPPIVWGPFSSPLPILSH
jgi:hypothetical protein